jgi:hypothetical protein
VNLRGKFLFQNCDVSVYVPSNVQALQFGAIILYTEFRFGPPQISWVLDAHVTLQADARAAPNLPYESPQKHPTPPSWIPKYLKEEFER